MAIVDRIKEDLLAERPAREKAVCLQCGYGISPDKAALSGRGRFCSDRCQVCFDQGWSVSRDFDRYSLPAGRKGFWIRCHCCQLQFDSAGLKYCEACSDYANEGATKSAKKRAEIDLMGTATRGPLKGEKSASAARVSDVRKRRVRVASKKAFAESWKRYQEKQKATHEGAA